MGQLKTQLQSAPETALSPAETLCLSPQNETLKVVQLSDCHLLAQPSQTLMGVDTERSLLQVLAHLTRTPDFPPDLVLVTGDLVQTPSEPAYARLFAHLETLGAPWVALPGNHDDPQLMAKILCRNRWHCAKRILAPDWQILCLNSHLSGSAGGFLSPGELAFLTASLKASDLPTLIAVHHPPLPVQSAWMDTMQLANGQAFLRLIEPFPQVKGVVFGHVHQVVERCYGSIALWSAPATCFQFKPGSAAFALDAQPAGWRWLMLQPDGKIYTWVERLAHLPPGLDFSQLGY